MSLKKSPHIVWVGPPDRMFFRSQGEVKCRPGNVIPKLLEQGYKLDVLIPYDASLLPKTKLSAARVSRHTLMLDKEYSVQVTKLSRGNLFPGIYMLELLNQSAAVTGALLAKAALSLAKFLKRSVDIFHVFDAQAGLLPIYLHAERSQSRLLRDARTFVTVNSLREFGTFSPVALPDLAIPPRYFNPDGIEFYGKGSALKSALQFCDRIAVVEGNVAQRKSAHRNGATMDGVLAANARRTYQWLSERSARAHQEVYETLLAVKPDEAFESFDTRPVASSPAEDPIQQAVRMWGPFPSERYGIRTLSLLVQSPTKAYVFWEWSGGSSGDLGLLLENESSRQSAVLMEQAGAVGEFWFTVTPSEIYSAVLAERQPDGSWKPLLRSARVRIPRNGPSSNRNIVFIDVRTRKRSGAMVPEDLSLHHRRGEGSSAWEWSLRALTQSLLSSSGNPTSPSL